MGNAPRVNDMSGCASVDRFPVRCAQQETEKQDKGAMKDKMLGRSNHRDRHEGPCEA